MAWYNGGAWGDLRVDHYGHCLTQMMFAVNEREAFLGRTLSTWGGLGTYPSAWMLDGLPRGFGVQTATKSCDDYLLMIQESIASLWDTAQTTRFVRSDWTNWDEASLFAAAGSVDHWLSLAWPSGMEPYFQLRAVIEQLVYTIEAIEHDDVFPAEYSDENGSATYLQAVASIQEQNNLPVQVNNAPSLVKSQAYLTNVRHFIFYAGTWRFGNALDGRPAKEIRVIFREGVANAVSAPMSVDVGPIVVTAEMVWDTSGVVGVPQYSYMDEVAIPLPENQMYPVNIPFSVQLPASDPFGPVSWNPLVQGYRILMIGSSRALFKHQAGAGLTYG